MGLCVQKTSRNSFSKWCAWIWQEFGLFCLSKMWKLHLALMGQIRLILPITRTQILVVRQKDRTQIWCKSTPGMSLDSIVTWMKCDWNPRLGETLGRKCPVPLSQPAVKQLCSEYVVTTSPYTTALLFLDHIHLMPTVLETAKGISLFAKHQDKVLQTVFPCCWAQLPAQIPNSGCRVVVLGKWASTSLKHLC